MPKHIRTYHFQYLIDNRRFIWFSAAVPDKTYFADIRMERENYFRCKIHFSDEIRFSLMSNSRANFPLALSLVMCRKLKQHLCADWWAEKESFNVNECAQTEGIKL